MKSSTATAPTVPKRPAVDSTVALATPAKLFQPSNRSHYSVDTQSGTTRNTWNTLQRVNNAVTIHTSPLTITSQTIPLC